MQFSEFDLDGKVLSAIDKMGFKTATSIQQLSIPEGLMGRDILASAPTGTGKTAAFLIPAIQYLLDFPRRDPGFARVLIMTPTRELAYQVHEQCQLLAANTHLKIGVVTGGINYGSHKEIFEKNNDILIATPGRLMEYLETENFHAENVELLILDEADRMLDMGFKKEMLRICDEAKNRRQCFLFSATLEGDSVELFADRILNDPALLEAEPSRKEKGKIHQWVHLADDYNHKLKLLVELLKNEEEVQKAIVFVKTRERLEKLVGELYSHDIKTTWLRGEMPQDKRMTAMANFQAGRTRILVATDVAARGIDVQDITHVFNFDMPRTADIYVHRIGRTGRAGKKGTAISLVEAHDMAILGKVQRYTEQQLKSRVIKGLEPKNKPAKLPKKKKDPAKIKAKKKAKAKVKKKK
ncbi:ATP-dependent RNA helicase SrmB [Pseudoalteromonas sp. SS15]|jgi:ATP-dependent RNA helicase SrmB|uniref:ATP-dependent RNA helicase SrmB n=1 Tax=Pseudoalteromonas phenolica TaxID=161398 RepID=A0A0S2K4X6_9GAMM|nr:ATP-dependent RNA helicase SrmB [Pseudoalteromonas phenolica]ALO43192.1 ATP-dependent RNA helicase SrmB [Pseudoalteromonas phenolica]MBE0355655.1 ATP-dependent RNA helicase SrmB [Pseudoalteromonas phenolica O-BC30]TLX47599.1 ATP-dependent RNA helicase SrmB [Pseudoalteromonas phenolica]TMN92522.1 ATP-dependent RNA helicase SrmB [Pseudoalteromonas phenolica]TMP82017.1 ATP-dependent RNA helicase SrmB [Pseudoalteromonas phenolica]|tara:strand:- start:2429 stop:3661 length:1233 start_codon:yes stop_codon:yes gene_type:complete